MQKLYWVKFSCFLVTTIHLVLILNGSCSSKDRVSSFYLSFNQKFVANLIKPRLSVLITRQRQSFTLRGGTGGDFQFPEIQDEQNQQIEKDMEEIRNFAKVHDLPLPCDDPKAVNEETFGTGRDFPEETFGTGRDFPDIQKERNQQMEKDMEEIRNFAKAHDLPIPSDDPSAVNEETLRNLFPGGGNCGFDDPRLRYLAQVLPAIEERVGSDQLLFWPGERVVISPQNPRGPSYNATVVDLPLILTLEEPCSTEAYQYHYMRFQSRFETSDNPPQVLTEDEFLDRFYPDMDR